MSSGQATGAAYLQQVLSKITDPELKAKAEAVFANAVVQTEIGGGVAGQAEIDRQLQDLRAKTAEVDTLRTEIEDKDARLTDWHTNLAGWADSNKEFIRLGKAAKAGGGNGGGDGTKVVATVPDNVVTKDDFASTLKTEMGGVLNFALDQSDLQVRHYDLFGRPLDIRPLIAHPKIRELGLTGVYELVHKDALTAKTKELNDAAEAKIRTDERQKVLAERVEMPYPGVTGVGSGSPLDALTKAGSQPLVDQATAEYHRLQTTRTA